MFLEQSRSSKYALDESLGEKKRAWLSDLTAPLSQAVKEGSPWPQKMSWLGWALACGEKEGPEALGVGRW